MIITSDSREKGLQTKQETENAKLSNPTSSSTRQWSAFRNPRIVRVSRSFGGKDRHSKVCTIRGLRDRRIRLSVPTAIQLYDLQDRLGLNQPSKVIDWLIDVTKEDIDKLPPLHFPPGFGTQLFYNHKHVFAPHREQSFAPFLESQETASRFRDSLGIQINNGIELQERSSVSRSSRFWEMEATLKLKNKEVENFIDKGKWIKSSSSNHEEENQDHHDINHSSLPAGLFVNNSAPAAFNSYCQFDNSLPGRQHGMPSYLSSQPELSINSNAAVSFPLASQFFFCQPNTHPSLYPAYLAHQGANSTESESREVINRLQINPIGNSGLQQGLIGSSKSVAANYPWLVHLQNNMDQSQHQDRR